MVFGSAFLRHPGHRTGLFSGRGESRCCPPGSRACKGSRSIRGFHETLTIVPDVNNKKCIFSISRPNRSSSLDRQTYRSRRLAGRRPRSREHVAYSDCVSTSESEFDGSDTPRRAPSSVADTTDTTYNRWATCVGWRSSATCFCQTEALFYLFVFVVRCQRATNKRYQTMPAIYVVDHLCCGAAYHVNCFGKQQ